jgi:hypothetical protein
LAPEQVLAEKQPDKVRVTLTNHWVWEIHQPAVSGDSLTGMREGQQVTVPLSNIEKLELREGDAGKSVGAAIGITVGLAAVAVGIFLISCDECFGTGGGN